jgi:hypothetical protein
VGMIRVLLACVVFALLGASDGFAKQQRSSNAHTQFMKQYPCPATGRASGACPGYVIDHVVPLVCGGADAPANMQWQTVAEARAKDRWERNCELWLPQ